MPGADAWSDHFEALYSDAFTRFGTRCLWNVKPSRTAQGMRVIADQLRTHGGMDAWRLATEIREALDRAAG